MDNASYRPRVGFFVFQHEVYQNNIYIMENNPSATKKCPHCQKDIDAHANKCPHCQSDLRTWVARHPVWSVVIGLVVLLIIINSTAHSYPSTAVQSSSATPTAQPAPSATGQNNPTLKAISTVPADYVGQSFNLVVNAEATNYYNYGFQSDSQWYSLQIWDDSLGGDYDGVYAYIPKTAVNKALIDQLLVTSPVTLKIHAEIPSGKYQTGSNAFMQIDSWSVVQN